MGNAQSGLVYRKLSKEIPPVKKMGHDNEWVYRDLGMKAFVDEDDRKQFIYAVIAVATENGLLNLDDHEFKLMYSRRENEPENMVARIVAIKDGTIKAKIEPETGGVDQREAFMAMKKDVEIKLDKLLQSVPSGSISAGPSSSRRAADAPPAYSSAAVGVGEKKRG